MTSIRSHLDHASWKKELERLQVAAAGDEKRWQLRKASKAGERVDRPESLVRLGGLYLAVSAHEGRLLYLLARAAKARYIVEFGASYGVSTLFLGAAAADNAGHLVTTEVHPEKCLAIRQTLIHAELDGVVELLEGDARETLLTQEPNIDMLFLDGWKSQYLPLLTNIEHLLAPDALVVADNVDHEAAADFCEHMATSSRWFAQRIGDMLVSVNQVSRSSMPT